MGLIAFRHSYRILLANQVENLTFFSGLKDNTGQEIPMLSEDAYGRFKATPSNVAALNLRIKKQYGKDIDLKSEEAEKLRRIEAFKDVERQKPRVNASRVEKEAPQRSHAFYFGGGFGWFCCFIYSW